jgi:hypothetical protein
MDTKKKFMKMLEKKPKQTLKMERQELQDQQAVLRVHRSELERRRVELKSDLDTAKKAKQADTVILLEGQIKSVEEDISKISDSYMKNAEVLEIYSKVLKNDKEGKSTSVGAAVGAVTGLGALGLGWLSLKKAYQSDIDGSMVNKKVLDVFNRLNPLRILGKK